MFPWLGHARMGPGTLGKYGVAALTQLGRTGQRTSRTPSFHVRDDGA
jgi:hypothetical protein